MSGWEPYPDESFEAFAAFCTYRDMGPGRSIDKVAVALNPEKEHEGGKRAAYGRLFDWSSRYHWVARAREHDLEQFRIDREVWETERREMARKRLSVSRRMLDMVAERLDGLRPEDIPVNQLPKWAESSAKVSVAIDENPYDALLGEMNKSEGDFAELILSDPEAQDLALKLDERLWELRRPPTSSKPPVRDDNAAIQ